MEITRTSLRSERQKKQQVPKQISQGQTQQRGGYGEELKEQLQNIGNIRRDAPVIKAKRVDPIISPTEQYTKDAVKTAMEKLKKFILGRGLGGDTSGATEQTTPFAGGGGGGGGAPGFFSGLTNDQLGLLSTNQLVARDIKRYGNTVPQGSFGSGSLKTIQDSPGSAVDTNIARHSVGTSEDQPATVLFQKEEVKAPMGTTFTGIGTREFTKAFTEKLKEQPRQTVAALPSDYKETEQAAFDAAKAYKEQAAALKASGLDKTVGGRSSQANVGSGRTGSFGAGTHGQGAPTKPKAGSFGISAAGKKQAEANKAEKKKATPAQKTAVKKATTVKKSSPSTSTGISKSTSRGQGGRKSSTSKKSSSKKSGGSKSGGSKSGGSKGGTKSSKSRGQGSRKSTSKGGSFGGKRRRTNTKRSRRRCDIRCKFDISILTNQNLIRDDLADVAYFVRELKENKL